MIDKCVCCGEIVPEGRQVCYKCSCKAKNLNTTNRELAVIDIAEHYGFNHQAMKMSEECGELITAIAKFMTGGTDIGNLTEEVADVLNLVYQMRHFLGAEKVDKIRMKKIDRQLKRMESEQE